MYPWSEWWFLKMGICVGKRIEHWVFFFLLFGGGLGEGGIWVLEGHAACLLT